VLAAIDEQKALDDSLFERLKAAISTFNHQFGVEGYSEVPDPAPKPVAPASSSTPTRPAADLPASGEVKKPRKKASK